MARQVRFHTLTLSGYGRYVEPTRFEMDGASCTFTSPNELGKSTFLAGLLSTLFGPDRIRGKFKEFLEQKRNWDTPSQFWGELELSVGQEFWKIRQCFDDQSYRVWRGGSLRDYQLHSEGYFPRTIRPDEPDPYADFLESILGIQTREIYNAMFTVSQNSTIATSWQIDSAILPHVYSPSVDRMERTLQQLYNRFREITRNTRDHNVSLGTQGKSNGRTAGRLDELNERLEELLEELTEARDYAEQSRSSHEELERIETTVSSLQERIGPLSADYDKWQTWQSLESDLAPAVEELEKFEQLTKKAQAVSTDLKAVRSKLTGDLAIFKNLPSDIKPRLAEHRDIVSQYDESAEKRDLRLAARNKCQRTLDEIQKELDSDVKHVIGRPQLTEQIGELAELSFQLMELDEACAEKEEGLDEARWEREELLKTRAESESLRKFETNPELLEEAQAFVGKFVTDFEIYQKAQSTAESLDTRILDLERQIKHKTEEQSEFKSDSQTELSQLKQSRDSATEMLEEAQHTAHEAARYAFDYSESYSELEGAPDDLLSQWDKLHELEDRSAEATQTLSSIEGEIREINQRRVWRWSLTVTGCLLGVISVIGGGWWDWVAGVMAFAIVVGLQMIFRDAKPALETLEQNRSESEQQRTLTLNELDNTMRHIGTKFLVSIDREHEIREIWAQFVADSETLTDMTAASATEAEIAELERLVNESHQEIDAHEHQSHDVLQSLTHDLNQLQRSVHEHQVETSEQETIVDAFNLDYFGSESSEWKHQPVPNLTSEWDTILPLHSSGPDTCGEVVDWAVNLTDQDWTSYEAQLDKRAESELRIEEIGAEAEGLEGEIETLKTESKALRSKVSYLEAQTTPFTAETEIEEIESLQHRADELSTERDHHIEELETFTDLDELNNECDTLMTFLEESEESLGDYWERFGADESLIEQGVAERAKLERDQERIERRLAEVFKHCEYDSADEVAREAGRLEGLVDSIRERAKKLAEDDPGLLDLFSAGETRTAERVERLSIELEQATQQLAESEQRRGELKGRLQQMELDNRHDERALDEEQNELSVEKRELERERDHIAAEFQETNRLMQELQNAERHALENRITRYFCDFTRSTNRRILLDEDMCIRVQQDSSKSHSPALLSHGAQDQLYFAVYLAISANFDIPFLLDDPFVNCDVDRLAAIRTCWDRMAGSHQMILVSHDEQLASWAPTLDIRAA